MSGDAYKVQNRSLLRCWNVQIIIHRVLASSVFCCNRRLFVIANHVYASMPIHGTCSGWRLFTAVSKAFQAGWLETAEP